MDWNQQFDEAMKSWTDAQKKVWDGFFSSVQGYGKSQSARAWESTLDTGKNMLKEMLKTQEQMLVSWVDGLSKMGAVPEQAQTSARHFQAMSTRWNKTQAELIENWFDMLKNFAPSSPADAWSELPQNMFKTWQDTTQGIIDAQRKWMDSWMAQARDSDRE